MSYIIGFLIVIFIIFFIVLFHELGHAIAAKLLGVKIQRISFGLGRPLLTYQSKNDIEYAWSLWPVGGYVKLLNTRIHDVPKSKHQYCFDKQPCWKKVIILLAGALMNFLLAILAFQMYFLLGYQELKPVISAVSENSVAYSSGMRAGDTIIKVAGYQTHSWQDVGIQFIQRLNQKSVSVVVVNETGQEKTMNLNLLKWQFKSDDSTLFNGLGIQPDIEHSHIKTIKGLAFLNALKAAIIHFFQLSVFLFSFLMLLLTGYVPFAILLGPVGAISEMIISFYHGLSAFCFFIGYFSMAVGWLNLIPFPSLDGCAIVYAIIEKIRKKPVSVALEVLLQRLSIILLVVFFIQLLLNDLKRYVN